MKNIYHISFDDIDFEGLREIIFAVKRVAEHYDTQCMLIGTLVSIRTRKSESGRFCPCISHVNCAACDR